jgi:hypothetical protein
MPGNISTVDRRNDLFAQRYNARSLQWALEQGHPKRLSLVFDHESNKGGHGEAHLHPGSAACFLQGSRCRRALISNI